MRPVRTYCTIPYIRGRYRSFPLDDVRADVAAQVAAGAREIVLIAQDTGRWGADFDEPSSLAALVAALAEEFPQTWFRIMYIQPEGLSDELLDAVAAHDNVCDYFDIPLQHVDAGILRAMNRHRLARGVPGARRARARARAGRHAAHDAHRGLPRRDRGAVRGPVLLRRGGAVRLRGRVPVLREEGTRAFDLPGQLDEDEKNDRAQRLRDLADAGAARASPRASDARWTCWWRAPKRTASCSAGMCQAPGGRRRHVPRRRRAGRDPPRAHRRRLALRNGRGVSAVAPSGTAHEKLWTPANIVTLLRICLVPVFVVAIISPWPAYFPFWDDAEASKPWIAAGIFILLAATDGLDGYLARSRGEVTNFGKFIDPLADKILVAAALLALIELGVLPSWVALVILTREFIVSGIRMVAASQGVVMAASWYGKAKTVTQIIAIVLFIVKDSVVVADPAGVLHNPLYLVSWAVMLVALALTIVSMLDYFVKAKELLGFAPSGKRAKRHAAGLDDQVEGAGGQAEVSRALSAEEEAAIAPEALGAWRRRCSTRRARRTGLSARPRV
ncbi:MAG: CDP-diacylglycerol--glycerol-3-phosphate 3-phosphatidyltransferase [Eggerthellaceae bacterium]